MAMGCASMATHRGQTITGRRSVSARTISSDRLPEPMTIEARNSTTSTPLSRSDVAGLVAAPQVGGQVVPRLAQSADVDDAPDAGLAGRLAEVAGRLAVEVGEVAGGAHRMHQVVGRLDARQGAAERRGVEDVAAHHLGRGRDPGPQGLGIARERTAPAGPRRSSSASSRPPMYPVAPVTRMTVRSPT